MSVTDHAALLRYAAERAVRAPSIHNTQPWRFVLTGDALEIHADRTRGLEVLDPRGRQLTISCGCALYNARVAIAAAGYEPIVHRLPDEERPDLMARVSIGDPQDRPGSADLDRAIDHRRTNRRPFAGEPVPDWLITELVSAARAEQTVLLPITEPAHRSAVARLNTEADQVERADPKYLDELAVWTTDDPRRLDGVHAASVPYAGPHPEALDPLPVRNFDVRGMGWLPPSSESGPDQCLLLLCSDQDDPRGWLRAGEALEHVWLTLTEHSFWASPLSQLIEVRGTHDQLQLEMGLTAIPQTLLRVGRAPETVATPRRPIADVVTDLH
ncbi:MAG: nitroreductase [Jatrophihabitans sp.]